MYEGLRNVEEKKNALAMPEEYIFCGGRESFVPYVDSEYAPREAEMLFEYMFGFYGFPLFRALLLPLLR